MPTELVFEILQFALGYATAAVTFGLKSRQWRLSAGMWRRAAEGMAANVLGRNPGAPQLAEARVVARKKGGTP